MLKNQKETLFFLLWVVSSSSWHWKTWRWLCKFNNPLIQSLLLKPVDGDLDWVSGDMTTPSCLEDYFPSLSMSSSEAVFSRVCLWNFPFFKKRQQMNLERQVLSSLDLSLLLLTVHPLTLKDNQTLFLSDFLLSYSRVNITHIHILHVNLMIIGKASSNFVTEAAALFLPSNHHQDPVCLSRYPSDNLARGSSGTKRKRKREREFVVITWLQDNLNWTKDGGKIVSWLLKSRLHLSLVADKVPDSGQTFFSLS